MTSGVMEENKLGSVNKISWRDKVARETTPMKCISEQRPARTKGVNDTII